MVSRSVTLAIIACLLVALLSSCRRSAARIDPAAYAKEIATWQAQRFAELKSQSGWLTLIGLFWLKEGDNKFGSDGGNDVVLPKDKVDPHAGAFVLKNGHVSLEATQANITLDGKPVKSVVLKTDDDDHPSILHIGSLSLQIIKRGEKLGLRVKDSQNPDRLNFKGTEFYPPDFKWRVEATFDPYKPPKPMPILNVLGMESAETSPGAIRFRVDGQEYRLDALIEKGEPKLFMIFADKTTGKETYPAGRYLYVDPPDANGRTVIDFNKAYSPPCAFTKFATCPLPPKQNRLPLAIEAGERYQRQSH
jgi:uncharacterized protein